MIYFNGEFIRKKDARVSPDDRGFIFSDGVYEVVKAYKGRLFQFDSHVRRLKRSLKGVRIEFDEIDQLESHCDFLAKLNSLEKKDFAVYMQITRGAAVRTHCFPEEKVSPTIYMKAFSCTSRMDEQEKGVKIILSEDIRSTKCDVKSVSLLPNVLATQEAKENDALETVFVRDGFITEGASSNFCAVFDNVLTTHPENRYILSGITRKVVLELCEMIGIEVHETPISEERLEQADEMMVLSTTDEITPVVRFNDTKVKDGNPGPVTRRLQQAFRQLVIDF